MNNRTGIPSRESTAEQQVHTALSVLHALLPYVLEPQREPGKEVKEMDGGVECAVVATFVKACNRLDAMLDDPSRWRLEDHDRLYDSMVKSHEAQQGFLKAQTDAANIVQRPSYQLRPVLAQTLDNLYIAYYGNPQVDGGCLIGRGKTPKEALEDFDRAFERTTDEQFRIIAGNATTAEPSMEKSKPGKGKGNLLPVVKKQSRKGKGK